MFYAKFSCNCTESKYYAKVYPWDEYQVYLCPKFWTAPLFGEDSQAGTIVHEMTHFPLIANSDDLSYDQPGTHAISLMSDEDAAKNANAYEYFAENDPYLP